MKKTLLLSWIVIALVLGGCVSADAGANTNVPLQTYDSDNGYTLDIPDTWVKGQETETQVTFSNAENSMALTISSELGGVDYYSLEEIMDQLTDTVTTQLFSDFQVTEDKESSSAYTRVVDGSNADGAQLVTVLHISQPFLTIRHYLLFVVSKEAYNQNSELINQIIDSFSPTLDEDQYLQLMSDRRAAEQEAKEQEDTSDKSPTENEND